MQGGRNLNNSGTNSMIISDSVAKPLKDGGKL